MGQYFKPINIDKSECLTAWDFDNGAKLMEHSWVGNNFVNAAINLLIKGNSWYGCKFAWVGDYSESCDLYDSSEDVEISDKKLNVSKYKYLLNHTNKEFVKIPKDDENIWQIHPLPLLTAIGNYNNGGSNGEFNGKDENQLIGSWAKCVIEPTKTKPIDYKEIIFDLVE